MGMKRTLQILFPLILDNQKLFGVCNALPIVDEQLGVLVNGEDL